METTGFDSLFADLHGAPPPRWSAALARFAQADLAHALGGLLGDAEAVARVGSESYIHGNGFAKLVLARSGGMVLRLHVAGGAAEENIHDHRWSFASTILTGEVEDVQFVDGGGTRLHAFVYDRSGGDTRLRRVGAAHVDEVTSHRLRAGDRYWQAGATLHQIRWTAGCRTLVVTAPPHRPGCRLLSAHEAPQERGGPLAVDRVRALIASTREVVSC